MDGLDLLGRILTAPGFTDELIHLYLARDLADAEQALESGEVLTVEPQPFERAVGMCFDGTIRDAKSMCALLLAQQFLQQR